ncbi:cytochrome-c oxidase, cbb3-type subunit III [Ferrimonas sediminicola]|uniref:Cbb3-type cytochrome c oxidase subunit n=1 Tax=Ferrimonas sediminicola TaxID=2569538 RepID=A0A4U1BK32_9GAMM|nr:cytochrome-c oxidase, cbb3-type subunit III [Ferrimonas sediminicola]TKB50450.1 cytochrome-c oxidase, cbb3-type subunit III [Ferrimonas sediminicola]
MTSFWSIFITVITLGVIFGCLALLIWCMKDKMGVEEGEGMGHTFDGIEEVNNPLPKWWSYMFVFTIVFGLGYLAAYPGLGNWKGLLGWTSSNQSVLNMEESKAAAAEARDGESGWVQYDQEVVLADAQYGPIFKSFAAKPVEALVADAEALKIGQRLFLQNCAQCHGSDAKGGPGFPNLTDGSWLYGGDAATIKATIMNGRRGMMPPKGGLPVTDEEIPAIAEYIYGLNGRKHDAALAAQGQAGFMKGCFACHGMDGTGNKLMGAPNLTDKAWLYGGSRKVIEESIRNGRAGVMPAWKEVLGEDKVHLITAYVYSLSQG